MFDRDSFLLLLLWAAIILGCMGQIRLAILMMLTYGAVKFAHAILKD